MTETKFTPGPWQLVQAEYSDSGRYVEPRVFSYADPDDPKIICSMAVRDGTTEEANGLMVAAAPDLYEAARALEAAEDQNANCEECNGDGTPELCPVCFPLFDDARIKRRLALKAAGDSSCQ